jgi:hypothetical protein
MASRDHLINLVINAVNNVSPATKEASKDLQDTGKKAEEISKKQQDNTKKETEAQKKKRVELEKELDTLGKIKKQLQEVNKERDENLEKEIQLEKVSAGRYRNEERRVEVIKEEGKWRGLHRGEEVTDPKGYKTLREAKEAVDKEVSIRIAGDAKRLRSEKKALEEIVLMRASVLEGMLASQQGAMDRAADKRIESEKKAAKESIEIAEQESSSRVQIIADEHKEIQRLRKEQGGSTGDRKEQERLRHRSRQEQLKTSKIIAEVEGEALELEGKIRELLSKGAQKDDPRVTQAAGVLSERKFEIKQLRHIAKLQRQANEEDNLRLKSLGMAQSYLRETNEEYEEALSLNEKITKELENQSKRQARERDSQEASIRKIIGLHNKARKDEDDHNAKVAKEEEQLVKAIKKKIKLEEDARTGKTGQVASTAFIKNETEQIALRRRNLEELGATHEHITENIIRNELEQQRVAEETAKKEVEAEKEAAAARVKARKEEEAEAARSKTTFSYDKDKSLFDNAQRGLRVLRVRIHQTNTESATLKNTLRNIGREGGALTRRMGRLGLAIRGLAVVGIVAFARGLIATLSALAATVVGLAGSLVYAAGALGGVFLSAVAQAIPVVGLLAATMQRLSLISEAVNQAELAKKNTFGDTGAEDTAIDNSNAIADAQEALKEAQEGVTEARKEAAEQLRDLTLAERQAELQLRSSILGQSEAQRQLTASIQGGDVESVARDQLGVDEARFGVRQSRYDLNNIRRERRDARRKGIAGSDPVVDAVKGVADAQRQLADAHRNAARAADTQVAAEKNLEYALNELTGAEKKLFKQFMNFRDRFEKATRPITNILIRAISDAFTHIEKLLLDKDILAGFTELAHALGNQFRVLAKVLTGPAFKQFFLVMMDEAAKNMPIITKALIALAKIFANLAVGAAPALNRVLRWILEGLDKFAEHTSDTSSMNNFFQTGVDHLQAWVDLIGSVLGLFGELMGASGDSQLGVLSDLTDTINGAKDALAADDSGARSYFEDAAEGLSYLGQVVVAIGKAFIELSGSGHIKALADVFSKVLIPGMVRGIEFMGIFAILLDELIEVPLAGTLFKWGVAFAFIASSASLIVGLFKPLYTAIIGFTTLFSSKGIFSKAIGFLNKSLFGIDDAVKTIATDSGKAAKPIGLLGKVAEKSGLGARVLSKGLFGIPVVGWIIAAVIEVVIGAITALKDNFLGITDIMGDAISDFFGMFSELGDAFGGLWNEIFGGTDGMSDFMQVLGRIIESLMIAIKIVGQFVGSLALLAIFNAIVTPIKLVVHVLTNFVKTIVRIIKAFKALFSGEISIGEFFAEMGDALLDGITGLISGIFNILFNAFKGLGKFLFNAVGESLKAVFGAQMAEDIINAIIDVINWVIRKFNSLPLPDVDEVGEVNLTDEKIEKSTPVKGYRKYLEGDTKAQDKKNKKTKEGSKYEKEYFAALQLSGGQNKTNVRLNNRMADSLNRTSKAHKRARGLQESIIDGNAKARRSQARYADAIERTGQAEARLSKVIGRTKNSRQDYNEIARHSIGINRKIVTSSRDTRDEQNNVNTALINANLYQAKYNLAVARGSNYHDLYQRELSGTTNKTREQSGAVVSMSKKYIGLNDVLRITGMNSRALGMVFKSVTNKILTKFNVSPVKIELPEVAGMFKQATGGASNFQSGGYFGNKKQRGPDDRIIKVAGGEAILTGHQQQAVNHSLAIANRVAGTGVDNLDTLFTKDRRPHASAPAFQNGGYASFNKGGRADRRANAGGKSILLPKRVPDADNALPGLDLVAWLANKYFGLSVTSGLRPGDDGDHGWGGAVDLSNGSSPTPQMDAAWQWFANTLGSGGAWTENYSGGAISQMLYRTMIGGNHFNHIHIALQDQYARSTEALTKILTGQAVPVGSGGMFTQVPQLKKPKIKGDNGVPKRMLQGQSNKLTKAANKYLKDNIVTAPGGISSLNLENIAAYKGKLNKQFPEGSSIQIAPWQAAMLAEKAGMPGITFAQIAKGESDFRPGAVGDDAAAGYGNTFGLGLWQITTGVGNDDLIAKYGGRNAMFNPWLNALAARELYKGAGGITPWYGTSYVTGDKLHWDGHKNIGLQRGGKVPEFDQGGIVPGKLGQPMWVKAHGGETILPTHKYQSGGSVPGFNKGGKPMAEKGLFSEINVRFQGNKYDIEKIGDLILLISDRIDYFVNQIELNMTDIALATAKWTYKIVKVNGKKVVTRARTAQMEASRSLRDLIKEYGDIQKALIQTREGRAKAKREIRKTQAEFDRKSDKLRNQIQREDNKKERKELQKELEKLRSGRKDDLEKLRTSLKNTNNKAKELQQRRADNIAARYEAQLQIFDEAMNRFDQKLNLKDTKIRIAELSNQDDEGELTEEGKEKIKGIYGQKRDILLNQRKRIQRELNEAKKSKDREETRRLTQALADNKLALLENSASIKELDKSVEENNDVFTFKTTAWQQFRTAILNGNGQILPEFEATIPQLATGGYIKSEGMAYLHAAEVVVPADKAYTRNNGPLVDTINFTQPTEVADPIAISNQIGFKLSTLKSQ